MDGYECTERGTEGCYSQVRVKECREMPNPSSEGSEKWIR